MWFFFSGRWLCRCYRRFCKGITINCNVNGFFAAHFWNVMRDAYKDIFVSQCIDRRHHSDTMVIFHVCSLKPTSYSWCAKEIFICCERRDASNSSHCDKLRTLFLHIFNIPNKFTGNACNYRPNMLQCHSRWYQPLIPLTWNSFTNWILSAFFIHKLLDAGRCRSHTLRWQARRHPTRKRRRRSRVWTNYLRWVT